MAFAVPSQAAAHRVLAQTFMEPQTGGTLMASNGVGIRVPRGALASPGEVSVTALGRGVYDVHIDAPWSGRVSVTLPLRSRTDRVLHDVGGVWVNESRVPGQATVSVTQLSSFTDFLGKTANKVAGKLCLTTNLVHFIECVGGHIDGKIKSWIESKLPHNCAVQLAEGGNPLAIAKASQSGDCVGQVGLGNAEIGAGIFPSTPTSKTPPPPGSSPAGGGTTPTPTPGGGTTPGPPPSGSAATVSLAQGPAGPQGYRYAITLAGFAPNASIAINCYDSVSPGGFYPFSLTTNGSGDATTASHCYSGDGPDHWVIAGGVESNHVTWGGSAAPPPPPPPPPPATYAETVGGNANTWTNYANAGGNQGPTIPSNQTVQISCKLTGFRVADGDTWWYRIASSPWNNAYYVSADAFYNNGQTSGSLHGTPFVDNNVPDC